MDKFHGEVPMTVERVVQLPGVGRKPPIVITSVVDQQPNYGGRHPCIRVAARIGPTVNATTPLATEKRCSNSFRANSCTRPTIGLFCIRYICVRVTQNVSNAG